MKKFKFRLQAVLEYLERHRDDCKAALVKANQDLQQAQEELARLETVLLVNVLSIQDLIPVSEVMLNAQIAQGLRQRIGHQSATIVLREQDVQKAMDAYMEANKEVKAVTILKERKLQEFNKLVAEQEASFLDELAIQRSSRQ